MDWITLFRRVGVSNPTRELAEVAEEYRRKIDLKRSSISAITLNASAKSLICVELACKACKQPYNPVRACCCVRFSVLVKCLRRLLLRGFLLKMCERTSVTSPTKFP